MNFGTQSNELFTMFRWFNSIMSHGCFIAEIFKIARIELYHQWERKEKKKRCHENYECLKTCFICISIEKCSQLPQCVNRHGPNSIESAHGLMAQRERDINGNGEWGKSWHEGWKIERIESTNTDYGHSIQLNRLIKGVIQTKMASAAAEIAS